MERKHRHLFQTTTSLSLQANLSKILCGECVLCATFLINRMPLKSIVDQTPYLRLYKTSTPLDHLKVFGCLVYYFTCKVNRFKFDLRGAIGVFLGYSKSQYSILTEPSSCIETAQHPLWLDALKRKFRL